MSPGRLEGFSDGVIAVTIALAFVSVYLACAIFLSVPTAYFIPDRELENGM